MDYKTIKNEFIKLKREELNYIDDISITSLNKKLSEPEKLELRRNLEEFETKSYEIFQRLRGSASQNMSVKAYDAYENLFDKLRDEEIDFIAKNARVSIKSDTINIVFNKGLEEIDYTLFTKIVRSGNVQITMPSSLKCLSNSKVPSLDKIDEKVFDYFDYIKRKRERDVYGACTLIYEYHFSDYQRPKIIFENFRNSLFLKEDENIYDLLRTMYYFDNFTNLKHYISSKFQDDVRPWPISKYIDDYGDACWKYDYDITIIKAFTIYFMEMDGSYRQYVNDGIIKDGFILYKLNDVEKIKEYVNRIDRKKKDSSKNSAKKLVIDNKPETFSEKEGLVINLSNETLMGIAEELTKSSEELTKSLSFVSCGNDSFKKNLLRRLLKRR